MRAVVERAPLQIRFEHPRLGRVLEQRPNPRADSMPLPVTFDPEPMGIETLPRIAHDAPFFFETGEQQILQWKSEFWAGNLLLGRRSGHVHFAWDVLTTEPLADGVRLWVSTSDPGGRRLVVDIQADVRGALRVRAEVTPGEGVITLGDAFLSGPDEAFHGFGGRHCGVDLRGTSLHGWVEQQNLGNVATLASRGAEMVKAGSPLALATLGYPEAHLQAPELPGGTEHYLFPNGPGAAYYPQNLFVSSRPYGFFLDRPELTRWRLAVDRPDAWQVAVAASVLDYSVAAGPAPAVIEALTSINGRHRMPPEWSHGPTLWRAVRIFGGDTATTYETAIRCDLEDIERLSPPLAGYAFEGWASLDREFVREVVQRLRARGIHPILYVRAFVAQNDGVLCEEPHLFADAVARGVVARRADGSPYVGKIGGFGADADSALLDFTNPDTLAWWERRISLLLELGADGFMQDFGEEVLADMHFANGETGATMHNRYPNLYHRATREILDRIAPARDIFFFTRAGTSGRPGAAGWESANFPGDETTDWLGASGLRSLIPDMLNRAIGGAWGYSTDIGGYSDFVAGATPKELFIRWTELAALTPFFRVHNSAIAGTRTPWSFDDETYELWLRMCALHQCAVPLIRRLWLEALRTGMPPLRPLWLAFPEDREAARQDQQFMVGNDVLVAPVVTEGATSRDVWFPAGEWVQPESGATYRGPARRYVAAPLLRLPYFFRAGTLPFEPPPPTPA